jgi:hypothetical protein
MSELHGSRKLLGDALEAADPAKFGAAGSGDTASAAVAVAALIQMERALLDVLQNSKPVGTAHPSENEGLSREERQRMSEESAAAMRNMVNSCVGSNAALEHAGFGGSGQRISRRDVEFVPQRPRCDHCLRSRNGPQLLAPSG